MSFQIPSRTRVVACQGGLNTQIEWRPLERPQPGELLLGLRQVGFCGTDLFKLENNTTAAGTVLGHELVGTVIAIGEGIDNFSLGDRIAVPHHVSCGDCALCRSGSETMCDVFRENLLAPGGFAEHVIVRPRAVQHCAFKLPEYVSDDAAVFLEPAACVLRGIDRSGLVDGAPAAVVGAGSMGLLHLALLRAYRPNSPVLIIDVQPKRCEFAKAHGAAEAVHPDQGRNSSERLSGGLGVDVVFDTVGGAKVLNTAVGLTRQGGTVVLFAHAAEGEPASFTLNELFKYERRVLGTYSGSTREQQVVFDLLISGAFDPTHLISHRFSLDEFDAGVKLARQREALKIMFTPTAL